MKWDSAIMKKVVIGFVVAMIGGVICFAGIKAGEKNDGIENVDMVLQTSEESGWIGEKVIGDVDKAKLVIYEYADFGCSHCAEQNRKVNDLMRKHDGEIVVVFRAYDLGFQNGAFAARAATAAQLQGIFGEYKDLLFNNQAEWFYEKGDKLTELFIKYFEEASSGAGDVQKFKEDMRSEAVKKRLAFEQKLGKKVNLRGTPLFRINGENVPNGELIERVEDILKN